METLTVLYDDAHLVVCVKPAGILSEDDGSPRCMPQLLREHYRALGQSEEVFAVHRLDREVGGVMVYSRRPAVTGKLTGLVSQRQMEKEYLAVLTGHPQSPADTLTDLLFRDAKCNKSYVVSRMRKGVREASLSYEELGRADALSLVCIRLHTGRTHQIRVQFSSRGLPLLGDRRYGRQAPHLHPPPPGRIPVEPVSRKSSQINEKAAFSRFSVFYAEPEPCLSLWESCHRR